MGRGDKRTAKGKRFKGSYGISRPHVSPDTLEARAALAAPKKEKVVKVDKPVVKKAPAKKAAAPKKKAE